MPMARDRHLSPGALLPPTPETGSGRAAENTIHAAWSEHAAEAAHCLASMSSGPAAHRGGGGGRPASKPTRLSLACNACRRRKVRCDARQPKCQNCTLRGDVCETSDLRRPGAPAGARRRAVRRQSVIADGADADGDEVVHDLRPHRQFDETFDYPEPPVALSAVSGSSAGRRGSRRLSSSTSPATTRSVARTEFSRQPVTRSQRPGPEHVTWLSRAYRAQAEQTGPTENVEAEHQSAGPVAGTPDMPVNTDGSPNRLKVLGGSSLQCLFNFVDLYLAGYGFDLTAPLFRHGMSHSEEFSLSLVPTLPNLPDPSTLSRYVDVFFSRIWRLFPVVDRASVESDIEAFLALQAQDGRGLEYKVPPARVPALVIIYAIVCIGMNEKRAGEDADDDLVEKKRMYLMACYGLHGHLTAMPYHSSVQALLLISLALRGHCKDGQSWHIAGQAVRMAISLGLHKSVERRTADASPTPPQQKQQRQQQQADTQRQRLWWSCFALERLMQLECGRPSNIDHDYDHISANCGVSSTPPAEEDTEGIQTDSTFVFFNAWVSLAGIMGQISDRLYSHHLHGSGEMLSETARLAWCLSEWETSIPEQLRPRNTFYTESDDDHVLAVFLAQQYYHAQIAVLRSAIIFSDASFTGEVKKRAADVPEIRRVLGGASTCVNAARSLVMRSLQLADAGIRSTLLGLPQMFLASVVLALGILRAPTTRLARSDVELLTSSTEYVEGYYKYWGFQAAFVSILPRLRERVTAVYKQDVRPRALRRQGSGENGAGVNSGGGSNGTSAPGSGGITPAIQQGGMSGLSALLCADQDDSMQLAANQAGLDSGMNFLTDPAADVFPGLEFEELWNMVDADWFMYDTGEFPMPA